MVPRFALGAVWLPSPKGDCLNNKTKLSALPVLGAFALGCAASPMDEADNECSSITKQALFSKSVGINYASEPYQQVLVNVGGGLEYYKDWLPDVSPGANAIM